MILSELIQDGVLVKYERTRGIPHPCMGNARGIEMARVEHTREITCLVSEWLVTLLAMKCAISKKMGIIAMEIGGVLITKGLIGMAGKL